MRTPKINSYGIWRQLWSLILPAESLTLLDRGIPVAYLLDLYPKETEFNRVQNVLLYSLSTVRENSDAWDDTDHLQILKNTSDQMVMIGWAGVARRINSTDFISTLDESVICETFWKAPFTDNQKDSAWDIKTFITALSSWLIAPSDPHGYPMTRIISLCANDFLTLIGSAPDNIIIPE